MGWNRVSRHRDRLSAEEALKHEAVAAMEAVCVVVGQHRFQALAGLPRRHAGVIGPAVEVGGVGGNLGAGGLAQLLSAAS